MKTIFARSKLGLSIEIPLGLTKDQPNSDFIWCLSWVYPAITTKLVQKIFLLRLFYFLIEIRRSKLFTESEMSTGRKSTVSCTFPGTVYAQELVHRLNKTAVLGMLSHRVLALPWLRPKFGLFLNCMNKLTEIIITSCYWIMLIIEDLVR